MLPSSALLYVSTERVLYRGALGQPRARRFAASAWYLPVDGVLCVTTAQGETSGSAVAVHVPSGTTHRVEAPSGQVVCFLAEAEFGDGGGSRAPALARSEASGIDMATLDVSQLKAWRVQRCNIDAQLDRVVLGEALVRRHLDHRIADVVQRVRREPALGWQAAEAADHCGLSASRFMHLFKAEMGMGWRDFRAWTRARALLACVQDGDNLTQVALSLGYPDGTHFSHAIRQITGLRPRDIIAGSRDLTVWREQGVSPA